MCATFKEYVDEFKKLCLSTGKLKLDDIKEVTIAKTKQMKLEKERKRKKETKSERREERKHFHECGKSEQRGSCLRHPTIFFLSSFLFQFQLSHTHTLTLSLSDTHTHTYLFVLWLNSFKA